MDLLKFILLIKLWLVVSVCALPNCAEFASDFSLNRTSKEISLAKELRFKHELDEFYESYKVGNWKRIVLALITLKKIKQSIDNRKGASEFNSSMKTGKEIEFSDYPVKEYTVTTADGYILTLHRVLHNAKTNVTRIPILLMHGILESSAGWMALGTEHSLAFMLADANYDVWLGNARGTRPSQKHKEYEANGKQRKKYWSFSWHEIGFYDLPESIDYILKETNQPRLHYIGLSQGTTAFFVMASEKPQFNDKIITMNAMAPIAFLTHSNNKLLNLFDSYFNVITTMFKYFGFHSLDIGNAVFKWITEYFCVKVESKSPLVCKSILYFLDSNQVNCTSLKQILKNTPNSASLRQIYHYAQLKRSGKFRQYDYGSAKENQAVYSTTEPPEYNLTKISSRINLFYSEHDESSKYEDILVLRGKLPNVGEFYKIESDDFKHIDFIYSRFVRHLINDKIINVLKAADQL